MKKENWEVKKLGEVGKVITGSTPKTSENRNYNSNDYCFVKPSDFKSSIKEIHNSEFYISRYAYKNSRQLPVNSVLVTCIGNIGNIAINKVECTTNQQINSIIPYNDINSKFLAYSVFSKREYLQFIANAPVVPILNKTNFSNVEITTPPLPVQEAIVKELDSLHRLKELQEQQLTEYDNLAQSTFYSMFGDPIENERGSEVRKMGEVCEITNGRNQKKVEDPKGIYPIMGSGGIMGYANEFLCPKDTVIIGRKGTINKPFIVKEKVWIVDTAFGFVANNSLLNSHFLNYFCKSFDFNRLNVAVTIPSLRKIDLKEIPIPIPPLSLQSEFAERINKIEELKQLVKQSISQTQMLIDYTMDKYFN